MWCLERAALHIPTQRGSLRGLISQVVTHHTYNIPTQANYGDNILLYHSNSSAPIDISMVISISEKQNLTHIIELGTLVQCNETNTLSIDFWPILAYTEHYSKSIIFNYNKIHCYLQSLIRFSKIQHWIPTCWPLSAQSKSRWTC